MSGSSRKASSPSWRARSRRKSRSCGSSREAACRQLARVAVRSRAARSASPATSRASSRPSPALVSVEATDTASEIERTEWSSRTPASQIGYQSASATAAISGRSSCTRTRSRSPCGGSSRRPRLPTATSAIPSVPVCRGGAPRRGFGGGVPPTASARRPASQASTASFRAGRVSPGSPCRSSTHPPRSRRPAPWCATRAPCSQGVVPAFPGPHAHDLVDRRDPDLAVTDLPGGGGLDDGVHDPRGVELADHDLDAHLRHEVDLVLRPAVDLGVAPLAAEALDLAHGQTGDPDQLEGVLDVVELERLDDRGDELHARTPSVLRASACAWPTTDVPPPVPSDAKSYAVSACSTLSMPATSSSSVIRKPIVLWMTVPMIPVATNENTRTAKAPTTCRQSWSTPPP